LRFLILQSAGHHDGRDGWTRNDYLRECFALQHALRLSGHEADVAGDRHPHLVDHGGEYEAVILGEQYEFSPSLHAVLRRHFDNNVVMVQWIVDLHCHDGYTWFTPYMDLVLHATRELIHEYAIKCAADAYSTMMNRKGLQPTKHIWFPNAVDDRYFRWRWRAKTTDVAFIGSPQPARKEFLDKLTHDLGLVQKFATGVDMLDAIASTKIHVNKSIGVDLNYRVFETIGLGTCLCTNWHPDMDDLGFIDGENCLMYRDVEDCKTKIRNALHDGSWRRIGAAGHVLSQSHTYTQRVQDLIAEIAEIKLKRAAGI